MNVTEKALQLWGLEGAQVRLIAARENAVYRVDYGAESYALRLHRQGYRTDAQLAAELEWMEWLALSGLSVPAPIASTSGAHLQKIDGIQLDVLIWLEGETLDIALTDMPPVERLNVFRQLGAVMAALHEASDQWPETSRCDRPKWDVDGLLGETPLWDRFWDSASLTPALRDMMLAFRVSALDDLNTLAPSMDFGLIHADLVPANVMWTGANLHLIDFDDGGYGFRLFELATALLKHRREPDYDVLQCALLDGYAAVRPVDTSALPLFLALRAATYVGWNITRMAEDETGERNARFIAQAEELISMYLK